MESKAVLFFMAEVVAHLLHQPQTLPRSIEVIIVFLGQARTLNFTSTDGKTLQRCWPVFPEFIFKKTMLKLNWVSNGKKTQQVGITWENHKSNWESSFFEDLKESKN